MDKLTTKEIDYILSLVEFKAYETTIYSIEEENFLEGIINKLHKQKEDLKKEVNDDVAWFRKMCRKYEVNW